MNYTLKSPLDVQIELTGACNHRCRHCYNFWKYEEARRSNRLTGEQMNRIFTELKNEQVVSSTITGGEPLLYPELVYHALDLSEDYGIKTDINSNLTLATKEIVCKLASFKNLSILTSLLSFDERTHDFMTGKRGSHKQVLRGIRNCMENGIKVSVNMVLCKENMADIFQTAKLAENLGVKTFCATRAVPPLGSKNFGSYSISTSDLIESLDELIRVEQELQMHTEILGCYPKCTLLPKIEHRKFFSRICVAGKTTATIGANGDIRPCSHADITYGNIFSGGLKEAWLKMEDWRTDRYTPETCMGCALADICTCGCRIEAKHNGNISGMDRHAVPENVGKYPVKNHVQELDVSMAEKIFDKKVFAIGKNVRFRKESFGGVIFPAGTRKIICINKVAFDYLEQVNKCVSKSFSFDDFISRSGAVGKTDKAFSLSLVQKLLDKKIISERR